MLISLAMIKFCFTHLLRSQKDNLFDKKSIGALKKDNWFSLLRRSVALVVTAAAVIVCVVNLQFDEKTWPCINQF